MRRKTAGPLTLPPINGPLTADALVFFIRREVERAGFEGVVLGLSGGIDSALVAFLAARAIGPRRVTGLMLPHRISSKGSVADAKMVVRTLGIRSHLLDISAAVDGVERDLMTAPGIHRQGRLGNAMARVRMLALFDHSLAHRAMVLGTSNKSEIALGYATLFGDSASAVNPIGDLYKTDVYVLSRHLGVPRALLDKPPSADLWQGQTDEGEIGFRYADIDPVLHRLLDRRETPAALVARGADPVLVEFLSKKLLTTHYKRKIPVIAKLETRTFGVDFLYAKDILS
ncbi:MAG TPA: NAD+ synthase [bacterium]|nr:NAD+ synthase [bacterium]